MLSPQFKWTAMACIGGAVSVFLGACEQRETLAEAPAATVAAATNTQAGQPVKLSEQQRQFLGIEPIGSTVATDVLSIPGRVSFRAQAQSAIGATAAGRIVSVLVQSGDIVKAGAPLLVIDSADAAMARASLDTSAARLMAAEQAYKRQLEMLDKGVGLELEKQEAETRLKEARAESERSRHAADLIGAGQGMRVTVRAPVFGVVMNIKAAVGAMVAPGGEALVELGDPNHLQVVAQVPEGELRRIAVGQKGEVELQALSGRLSVRVESIGPRVDPESRRAAVYLGVGPAAGSVAAKGAGAASASVLRAGMMAQVLLNVASDGVLAIPVAAVLIKNGERRIVYVERADDRFEAREIQVGRSHAGRVQVLGGLTAGERVVVKGALLLDSQAEQLL